MEVKWLNISIKENDIISLLESWLISEAGFWVLTRRKERDLGGGEIDLNPENFITKQINSYNSLKV